jgi:2-polyprenyl-3-methyl-5-hydroxy-6-metoxy-1,4-benzoquinol methylase
MASANQSNLTTAKEHPGESQRGCPICGGRQCDILHTQKFILPEGHPLADGYEVVVCNQCGFGYADTQVSQRDYDVFYARYSKYENNSTSTGGGGSPEDARRLQEMARDIAKAIPDRQARLVDVGCANGGLLKELRALGYSRLCGIDPSPACVAAVKALGSTEGFVGTLSLLPPDAGEFDGVILSHVLEHVQDLQQAIAGIRRLTRPTGVVYVEVPDAARYTECLLAPFQDFNTEHINHFSAVALRNLFVRQGWHQTSAGGKTLLAAPDMPYPAVFGFFSKNASATEPEALENDAKLRLRLADYITASQAMMQAIDQKIQAVLATNEEVIVWGTGQLAMKLLGETCLAHAKISAFVDGNPINHGKLLKGSPILAPAQVQKSAQPIIVTSIIQGQAIAQAIQQLKLPNPIILLAD